MSIASDIRTYADNAVAEGRKVLDSTLSTAQAQFNDVSGSANDIVSKAQDAVTDLRASAEKAINFDAIKSAVEPYLAQARSYQVSVQDRAESLVSGLTKDPRVAKAVETLEERVVKPVVSLTGRGGATRKPAPAKATKPSPTKAARKPASTRPASAKPAAKKTTARKTAAKKTGSKA